MSESPSPARVRRIIGPSRAEQKARVVMVTGSALQAGAIVCAAAAIADLRGHAPSAIDFPALAIAAAVYLPAAYLTAYGFTHLNAARAALLFPATAVIGAALTLLLFTGEGGTGVSTQLEGETDERPTANFAAGLITSEDAARVLGSPANPPVPSHGFGNRVSSCEVHAVNGHGYVLLKVLQGPEIRRAFERHQRQGQPVAGLGDDACIDKRKLVMRVDDTMVELIVMGPKPDDRHRSALVEVGGRVVERLVGPRRGRL